MLSKGVERKHIKIRQFIKTICDVCENRAPRKNIFCHLSPRSICYDLVRKSTISGQTHIIHGSFPNPYFSKLNPHRMCLYMCIHIYIDIDIDIDYRCRYRSRYRYPCVFNVYIIYIYIYLYIYIYIYLYIYLYHRNTYYDQCFWEVSGSALRRAAAGRQNLRNPSGVQRPDGDLRWRLVMICSLGKQLK